MSALTFKPATKTQAKLRMALIGPAGSGKTMTALKIAQRLAEHAGKPIAFIDTEHGSASKYADLVPFDVMELTSFHPERYIEAINAAQGAGYGVLVIDSLSHAWMGKDGALQLVDQATKRQKTANSYTAWGDVTPLHNALIEAMLSARLHIIVTMRSKMEYVQEKDANGKTRVRKIGLQPVQRDGMEFEFDVVADIDTDNLLIVGKTRCPSLAEYQMRKAGAETADHLIAWLSDGAPLAPPRPTLVEPEKISIPQRRELSDTAKAKGIPPEIATSIVQEFGFAKGNDVTVDKFEAVIKKLKDWTPPQPQPDPFDTTVFDNESDRPDVQFDPEPAPQPETKAAPRTEKEIMAEKRREILDLIGKLVTAGVSPQAIEDLIDAKAGVRQVKDIPDTFDANAILVAMETRLEQATKAKQAKKGK
jgi:hypothetical protein